MSDLRLDHLTPGPILVVADNDSIARGALTWAKIFGAAGRTHRVRLAGLSSPEAINAEAKSLNAIAILWAGSHEVHSLAATAAADLRIPLFNEESLDHARRP